MSMKAKILELLREKETYVSGQELCEQFGVSRTAVWKAIGQLKKEGYVIEAVQNKGYHLVDQAEEVYNQADIQSRLKTKWVGHPLLFFDSIDSTNIRAKLEAEQGAESGLLVVADQQTAGRGRTRIFPSSLSFNPCSTEFSTMGCMISLGITHSSSPSCRSTVYENLSLKRIFWIST